MNFKGSTRSPRPRGGRVLFEHRGGAGAGVLNAALIAPNVVNVIPQTIFVR